jgi:hypothetical protein
MVDAMLDAVAARTASGAAEHDKAGPFGFDWLPVADCSAGRWRR